MALLLGATGCGDDDDKDTAASPAAAGDGGTVSDAATAQADGGAPVTGQPGAMQSIPLDVALPIVFVHGYAGSAQQYDSQFQRFVANGYPAERIRAFEHDGVGMDIAAFVTGADAFIDAVRAEFKVDKVYLVGHSRGTFVSSNYVMDPTRAAKIAKYIALDGQPCPTVVPCIAPNQSNLPGQKHVEVATSAESFARQFEFLIGRAPTVTQIARQDTPVVISGRAVNFPANTGRAGVELKVWELVTESGARAAAAPVASFSITDNGNWGPVTVNPDKLYELELSVAGGNSHHFYPQRFLRSSPFVRLLSGPPDSPNRMNTNVSEKHTAVTVSRQREWLPTDVLEISTRSTSGGNQPPVNAIGPMFGMGATGMAASFPPIGIAIHDDVATPGVSSLAALPWFSTQAFQTGVDVFMPAANPTDGTITFKNLPRGDASKPQVLNVPNWSSTTHAISVVFSDSPQP